MPAELRRAALRQAWSADPAIRDFVGLSENSWDFNAPDPDVAPLTPEVVGRLVALASGAPAPEAAAPEAVADRMTAEPASSEVEDDADGETRERAEAADVGEVSHDTAAPAVAASTSDGAVRAEAGGARPRRHGGALPE